MKIIIFPGLQVINDDKAIQESLTRIEEKLELIPVGWQEPSLSSNTEYTRDSINKSYSNYRNNISILKLKLSEHSIEDQTISAYEQILKFKDNHPLQKEEEMIALGSCSGGIVSLLVTQKFPEIGITKILTGGTPWEGGSTLKNLSSNLTLRGKILFQPILRNYNKQKTLIDSLLAGSPLIEEIAERVNDTKVPIYAFGGKTDCFRFIFKSRILNKLFFKNASSQNNKSELVKEESIFGSIYHDGIVPLSSQIGESLPNINRIIIPGNSFHGYNTLKSLQKLIRVGKNIFKKFISDDLTSKINKIETQSLVMESDKILELLANIYNQIEIESE